MRIFQKICEFFQFLFIAFAAFVMIVAIAAIVGTPINPTILLLIAFVGAVIAKGI